MMFYSNQSVGQLFRVLTGEGLNPGEVDDISDTSYMLSYHLK